MNFKKIYTEDKKVILYSNELSQNLFLCLLEEEEKKYLSKEHLVIFYLNSVEKFKTLCEQLKQEGVQQVKAFNPYWNDFGATFMIGNAFRLVLCSGGYLNYKARIAAPTNNLDKVKTELKQLVGLKCIGSFESHRGFNGIMLASHSSLDCHFEFIFFQCERLPQAYNHSHQIDFILAKPFFGLIGALDVYYQLGIFKTDVPIATYCNFRKYLINKA
ncbi:hypothetical protein Psal006b_02950 [Piscirickettsia salmonis]|uniref:Glyoxalase n=1 Tax=Piscirickettsia salmonis TaxID=1238 RepID=A0AAC8VFV2_PISSA|nr:hypothetical protein [Piscirickettsia salmonis]AKP72844.1 hypothetical protein PSLF89_750 [Piscirickettsia salmonis LF-89 = ATCC VR-1361]ALB21456.1 glyoxalase [Piscirickettsia salmonis]ALY01681.1 hypothetical protein AWE47_01360 [Piscirickettsia salmonis]AMA41197.1 hypothetical protein AWJ11_01370 [Piscirickettsia salmonis]AOS36386.1 hypothetical protein AVM72_14355 [Piscirickettsia salmonis]